MELTNKSKLEIEMWDINRAIAAFWKDNPRVISEAELNNLRRTIKEFGVVLPPIFNKKTGTLVGGHQRIKAAQLEGILVIPMIMIDEEETKAKALALALNKIKGKWDFELLEKSINQIAETDILSLSGFSENDLIGILSDPEYEDSLNNYDFQTFLDRGSKSKLNPLITFKSPEVVFNCLREEYEDFIQGLYAKYGFDDLLIGKHFFEMIGLG